LAGMETSFIPYRFLSVDNGGAGTRASHIAKNTEISMP